MALKVELTEEQKKAMQTRMRQANVSPTVAFQMIQLPSKGWTYPEDNPLSKGSVKVKYSTAQNQAILNSETLIKKGIVLDEFIKSLLLDNVDIDDLLQGDKGFLLYATRILTYSNEYKPKVECPKIGCGQKFTANINLAQFKPKVTEQLFNFPRQTDIFQFNDKGYNIKFKLVNGHMRKQINKKIKLHKADKTVQMLINIASRIVQINGETEYNKIYQVVRTMPSMVSSNFRKYINKLTPQIDIMTTLTCDSCGNSFEQNIPIDIDFFWPNRLA